jgi:hypothetical protein
VRCAGADPAAPVEEVLLAGAYAAVAVVRVVAIVGRGPDAPCGVPLPQAPVTQKRRREQERPHYRVMPVWPSE